MVRSIIRYVGLTVVVIGIVVLMSSLISDKDTTEFKSNGSNSKYYTVSIRVLDKDTRKFISGGELVLKTSDGKVIDEWEQNDNIHRVTKLKNGTYILEQKSAALGYEVADKKSFKIKNSDEDVILYNEYSEEEKVITSNEVNVDNTLSVKSLFSYIFAIVIIGSGLYLVVNKKARFN